MGFPTYRPIEDQEVVTDAQFLVSLKDGFQKKTPSSQFAASEALAGKANLISPAFTGVPTAPTAAPGVGSGQLATTAFVKAAIDALPSGGDVTGPAGATAGHLPTLDATGKVLSDSGKAVADLATAAQGTKADSAVQPARAISAGTGLTGGGDLSADRSVALNSASIASLVKADSAAQLTVAQQFTKPQRATTTALTSGTTITPDLADSNDFSLTLGHNATLANPTSQSSYVGLKGSIACVQDGTGGRTLAFGSNWYPIGAATAPAAPTGANAKFRIDFHVVSATRIDFKLSSVGV